MEIMLSRAAVVTNPHNSQQLLQKNGDISAMADDEEEAQNIGELNTVRRELHPRARMRENPYTSEEVTPDLREALISRAGIWHFEPLFNKLLKNRMRVAPPGTYVKTKHNYLALKFGKGPWGKNPRKEQVNYVNVGFQGLKFGEDVTPAFSTAVRGLVKEQLGGYQVPTRALNKEFAEWDELGFDLATGLHL